MYTAFLLFNYDLYNYLLNQEYWNLVALYYMLQE